jgi:hypothetical protein
MNATLFESRGLTFVACMLCAHWEPKLGSLAGGAKDSAKP